MHTEYIAVRNLLMLRKAERKQRAPLQLCATCMRGEEKPRGRLVLLFALNIPLFFHSPWLSYLSLNLLVGGRLQLYSLLLCELMM